MKFLPFEKITYKTKLEAQEISKRISEITEPEKLLREQGDINLKPYEGIVEGMSFKINRIIGFKRGPKVIIKGKIAQGLSGTKVKLSMRLTLPFIVFWLIWFGIVGIVFFGFLTNSLKNQHLNPGILIPSAMLIFGYVFIISGFNSGSLKSKKYFVELIEAEIEK